MSPLYDVELEATGWAMLSFECDTAAEARDLAIEVGVHPHDIQEIEHISVVNVAKVTGQASEQDETIAAPLEDDVQEVGDAE